MKTHKRIAIYILSALVGLFLAFSFALSYAYFTKKDIYDGYISGQVELLFDRLSEEGMTAYGEAEGITASSEADWGTRENPYVISNVRHLYNLSELQRLGYFDKKHLSKNTANDLSHIPYFVVSTSDYHPTVIDGSDYRAILSIGTEDYPFIGSVKGAKGEACSVAGYSSEISVLYNVQVKGDPHDPDVGLFGTVGFLGTPPAEDAAEQTFLGTPSVLSTLVLHDVTVKVDASLFSRVKSFLADIALALAGGAAEDVAEGHRYSFTELYHSDDLTAYNGVPHENHHIGILAGHISYSFVEFISVFYSSGDVAAIDLSDTEDAEDGATPNYLSAAGILGFIYNLNPEYNEQDGSLTGGSGSNTSDLYYGIVGGGGLTSGAKAGYVLAKTIYNAYGYTAADTPRVDGATFLIKNATTADGTPLCEEWISNDRGTGQYYFYDGVFTFALSSQEDRIDDTFGDTTPTFMLGETDTTKWHANLSTGRKLVTAYLRRITTDAELQDAANLGKRLVVMHEQTTANPYMLSLYNQSVNSNSGRLNVRFTTAATERTYTDADTLAALLDEYDEAPDKFLLGFESGTDGALVGDIMASLRAGDGQYRALSLDATVGDDALAELDELRKQYKIFAEYADSEGVRYGYSYFSGETPVTADTANGMSDYYDYADSPYDGYFYYTGSTFSYTYYWQPKNGPAVEIDGSWWGPGSTFDDAGGTWQGETVYTDGTYTGVVVSSDGKFYNTNNQANTNGASLRKPIAQTYGFFYRPAGKDVYFYMSDDGTDDTTAIEATALTATGTVCAGSALPLYENGGRTGVLLDRYNLYTFRSPGADEASAADDNYMRMIKANFGWYYGGAQYTLWNGTNTNAGVTSNFSSAGLIGGTGTPDTVENSPYATVKFNTDGSCYIEYTIGTVAQVMSYNGTNGFITALARDDVAKVNIYVLETTQAVNHGSITFDPDDGTQKTEELDGGEYLFWPQAAVEVQDGGTKSAVDPAITEQFSLVSLEELAWNNGDSLDNGGVLHKGNLDKKFHMIEGINFGATISLKNLFGGIFGDIEDFGTSGVVQAPVGSVGTKANIPAGCVAFRVNKLTSEGQKIRVIVALPHSPYYETEVGYDLGDYNRYFCLWEMPEASSQTVQIFNAEDYVERFLLPRTHPFEPGTTPTDNAAESVTVSFGGNSYRCYPNGERLLVAYEFTVREEGIYVLGTSADSEGGLFGDKNEAPMEIVYFSVGGVASTGRDGASGSQIGTVDFVYANEGKIVTVTESSSSVDGKEDYSTYYPSYCLLYMIGEQDGEGFYNINSECVYINRYIYDTTAADPPPSSDGYRQTDSYAVIDFRRLRDKRARLAQYSRYADNVTESE